MKTAVIGAGAFGTVLARILAENGHDVIMWAHDPAIAETINTEHENKALFEGVSLPENIKATTSLEETCENRDLIVLVVASAFYRATLEKIIPLIPEKTLILSATKGLNASDKKRTSQVLEELLPEHRKKTFAVLSGPNIAREIAARKPTTTVISSHTEESAREIQKFFSNKYFRVYTNSDVIGTELGGTLKNIIAIAAGSVDGLELGDNAKSALMVRGMVEIVRFGVHHGAKPETFYGLAGMGDLITTCSSVMSRNHFVGESLAKGKTLKEILDSMTAVAEGVETTRLVHDIAQKEGLYMPMTEQIHAVLFEGKPVTDAIENLMSRELKAEA